MSQLTDDGHKLAAALTQCADMMGNPQVNTLIQQGEQLCADMAARFAELEPDYPGLDMLNAIGSDLGHHDSMALNWPWLAAQAANGNNLNGIVSDLEMLENARSTHADDERAHIPQRQEQP